jgi:hypothetical protein
VRLSTRRPAVRALQQRTAAALQQQPSQRGPEAAPETEKLPVFGPPTENAPESCKSRCTSCAIPAPSCPLIPLRPMATLSLLVMVINGASCATTKRGETSERAANRTAGNAVRLGHGRWVLHNLKD